MTRGRLRFSLLVPLLALTLAACHGPVAGAGASANTDVDATAPAGANAADVAEGNTGADVALVADGEAPDAATLDATVSAPDGVLGDVPGPAPVTTITIKSTATLGPGILHVRLMDYTTPVCEPTPADIVVFNGASALPAEVTVIVGTGVWLPVAAWLDLNGKPTYTSWSGDGNGVLTVLPGQHAPKQLSLTISASNGKPVCTAPAANTFLSASSAYVVPFSDLGVSHLLEGLAWNGSWWMAANVEGIGRVNLPANGKGVDGWTPLHIGDCRHLTRDGTRLYCTERGANLKWLDVDPATNASKGQGDLAIGTGIHAEGLTAANGSLYVTLHEAGVAVLPLPAAGAPIVYAKGLVADAWQVGLLPDGKVVVADGAAGLKVLAPFVNGKTTVLSALPLPGLSAHLAMEGQTVAVGALGGGMHLIDIAATGQATLLGSLPAGPWPVAGVDLHGGMAYLAAGRALLAVPVPQKPVGLLSALTATLTDAFMSLDVHAAGNQAFTAEYAYVRALKLDPAPPPPGALAVYEQQTWAKVGKVGTPITFDVWVWNPGQAPLELTKQSVTEVDGLPVPSTFAVPGPLSVAPGQSVKLTVQVTKSSPAPQQWRFNAATNDPARAWLATVLTETPLLAHGDAMPALALPDKTGKIQDVGSFAGGKPMVVFVSSETCPVAMERGAAIAAHIQPWLKSGKLAAVTINPTDLPDMKEVGTFKFPFVELFPVLTKQLQGGWSDIADSLLAQPGMGPIPPLPLVYVVDANGKIVYAHLGYAPAALQDAIESVTP